MALNSVNTNMGAMIALQSLETTQQQLAVTQKQISTGYRVADATDDGAAYSIAQGIRASVGALTSANQQLGNVQGLLSTTKSGLNNVSNMMASMRDVLVKLSDSSVQGTERSNYQQQYNSMLSNVKTFVQDADYNGKTLIGDLTGSSGTFGRIAVARNENGSTYVSVWFDQLHQHATFRGRDGCCATHNLGDFPQSAKFVGQRAQYHWKHDQLCEEPDHLQQRQSGFAEQRAGIAD